MLYFSILLKTNDQKMTKDNLKFNFIKPKKGLTLKYDNAIKVSYPDELYEKIRRHSFRKSISLQDIQRKAMEFYINHLEHDEIETQKFGNKF
jgi:hypothetical protein